MTVTAIDTLPIDTLHAPYADGVKQATSSYLGAPTDKTRATHALCQRFLRCDPLDPIWPHRDRCVVSEDHASATSTKVGR
jgi:transketolase